MDKDVMAKLVTGKRIKFEVELYRRGKTKKPSVNIVYAGDNYEGLHKDIDDTAFCKGADDICQQLIDHGDLD